MKLYFISKMSFFLFHKILGNNFSSEMDTYGGLVNKIFIILSNGLKLPFSSNINSNSKQEGECIG